mmetsp:Transcript_16170/g.33215  ORF Transcript_16170/g.33215 Transcript_16170/m.33215 type:complete len:186 (+) Transcript_16170:123-680(+)
MTSKSDRKNARGNFLTRSKQFQELLDKAFKDCDTDKSGSISKSELYVGMLSIHLTLAKYAGPAACYPPSREVSDELFVAADADKSGGVSKDEFESILIVSCAQIMSRMMVYYCVLILFVPWFAKKVIDSAGDFAQGGFVESVMEQVVSVSVFMVVVPLLWNTIDSKTETTIEKLNSTSTTDYKSD